jgi:outer membrane protein assembly factor BamB
MRIFHFGVALSLGCLAVLSASAPAADWPQWLGPQRNGSSPETGLLTQWPKDGPKIVWKVDGGEGYSSVAVAGGRAVTLVQKDGKEWVVALDAVKGTKLWEKEIGPFYKNNYGNGPRSTPTIDGKLVYAQSVSGPLVCLKAEDGAIVWQHDILKDFDVKNLSWGLSASPLVDGDLVFAIPGAPGAGVVAYEKSTGNLKWKSGGDPAAYATPVAVTVGGKKLVVVFNAFGLVAMEADSGKEQWRIPWKTTFDVNICTPLVIDGQMFVASGEQVGSTLFDLTKGAKPEPIWQSLGKKGVMTTYWANAVYHQGYLYGLSGEFDKRIDLNCVDAKTGKLMWSRKDFGKGAMTLADGHLWMSTKAGDLVLVHCNPKDYLEKARVPGFLGENRTVPTIANGRLYVRDLKHIYCLDISAGGK